MNRLNVSMRLTHRYVGTCDYMDAWKDIGAAKLTPRRLVEPPDPKEFSDGGTYVRFATLPAGLDARQRKAFRTALEDTLSKNGCHHTYDCCGCQSYSTRAIPTAHPRRVRLVTRISFNY